MQKVISVGFESASDTLNGAILTALGEGRDLVEDPCGKVELTDKLAAHGNQSMHCIREGPPFTEKVARDYQALDLRVDPYATFQPINRFLVSLNIYEPTQPLTGWQSFMTVGTGDGSPFTVDANPEGNLHLFVSIASPRIIQPITHVRFPFDRWFNLAALVDLTANPQQLQLFVDGYPLLTYGGPLLKGPFTYGHFGAYFAAKQQNLELYNDDIELWEL